jgi:hypothetical protein
MTTKFLGRTALEHNKTVDLTVVELMTDDRGNIETRFFVDVSDNNITETFSTEPAARKYIDRLVENAESIRRIEQETGCAIRNFADYGDGFSFTVKAELDAYKSAYKYRYCPRVKVEYSANIGEWVVAIYSQK